MIHNSAINISIRDPSLLISSFGNLSISHPVSNIAEPSVPVEILLVDQDSAKELTCAICLQLLTNPQQCKNGHLFCYSCISQYIERNPECPHCRCSLKETELSRSLFVEKHIQLLRVWCKYHFKQQDDDYDDWIPDAEGCQQSFPLEYASKHEKTCTFSWGVCKYCRLSTLRKKDLASHESSCPSRPSECPHCQSLFESSKLQFHLLECEMVPIICSQCTLPIKKPDYERHMDRECLESVIACPFHEYGCEEKISREESSIEEIREIVKDKKVLVLVSGGVDSTVCAALVTKALSKEKVYALHIDNGFMRKEESLKVKEALSVLGHNLIVVDASFDFSNATTTVKGMTVGPLISTIEPELKRKIIGDTFMRVAEAELRKLNLNPEEMFVAQGTLRPDLIESASHLVSSNASAIKTHHNDTELVRELRSKGRVIEPLKDYHKDEVRELGTMIGLSHDLVWRQPFPGPALAIRIICADKPFVDSEFDRTNSTLQWILGKSEMQSPVSEEHSRVREQLKGIDCSEIEATLLPVKTVGVQGDSRSYQYVVGVSGKKDWNLLFKIARIVPQICHNVNRVVYVFGEKVKGPVTDITPTYLTKDVVTELQEADDIVNKLLLENDLIKKLSQVPVILFPANFGIKGNRSIAIRPFITADFMTGIAAEPGKDFPEHVLLTAVERIQKLKGISRVVYDLTSKPPGTTEWE